MRYSHEIRQAKDAWDEIIAISESAEFEQAERIKELEERLQQALIRHSIQAEALQACWRFFDSIYGASSGEPILYDELPEDRQKLADEALDAISRWMHDDEEELKTEQKRIAKLALEAIMTAGMHHKIWYLERIMEACGVPVEEWRERYEWEEGIAP